MAIATNRLISDLVEVKGEFLPFVDLRQVGNASYRRRCRDSYVYTDEDFRYFQLLYRGIAGLLPQKKRNLILLRSRHRRAQQAARAADIRGG